MAQYDSTGIQYIVHSGANDALWATQIKKRISHTSWLITHLWVMCQNFAPFVNSQKRLWSFEWLWGKTCGHLNRHNCGFGDLNDQIWHYGYGGGGSQEFSFSVSCAQSQNRPSSSVCTSRCVEKIKKEREENSCNLCVILSVMCDATKDMKAVEFLWKLSSFMMFMINTIFLLASLLLIVAEVGVDAQEIVRSLSQCWLFVLERLLVRVATNFSIAFFSCTTNAT